MRYAVLSDIHANLEALSAVLDALQSDPVDRILCLGDIVGYGADSMPCWEKLQEREAFIVCGNHEAGCIGKLPLDWFNPAARAALEWTRDRLGFLELDTLRRLPLTHVEEPFTLVHSGLRHPERFPYLFDVAQMIDTLAVCRTPVCLIGHTHVPCLVEYDRERRRLGRTLIGMSALQGEIPLMIEPGGGMRTLINPGSVGQPRDGDARASFAIIDVKRLTLVIRRVGYDVASAQRKIREAGLSPFLADRLEVGR